MAKTENILIELDYDNMIVIDPNKVLNNEGFPEERNVPQENLVMYANLTCTVIPRTKLAIGTSNTTTIETINVSSFNMLNQSGQDGFNTKWTDELTGLNSIQGRGVNQISLQPKVNPQNSNDYFLSQTLLSEGKPGTIDTGLLGMKSISIRTSTNYTSTVTIQFIDIKGRALFGAGDNSIYSAFFNQPRPQFELTIKGYYGKAIKYKLQLMDFEFSTDQSGNFTINTTFESYKFGILGSVAYSMIEAVSGMYEKKYTVLPTEQAITRLARPGGVENFLKSTTEQSVYRGYELVGEFFDLYRKKGLIDPDMPTLTIWDLKYKLENFTTQVATSLVQESMAPLNEITKYSELLNKYLTEVSSSSPESWFKKYCDDKTYYVLNLDSAIAIDVTVDSALQLLTDSIKVPSKIYKFKPEIDTTDKQKKAISELEGIITKYNKDLNANPVLGSMGKFVISKKEVPSNVKINVSLNTILKNTVSSEDIDFAETYKQRFSTEPTQVQIEQLKLEFIKEQNRTIQITNEQENNVKPRPINFFMFGPSQGFDYEIKTAKSKVDDQKQKIESLLQNSLESSFLDKNIGFGFKPTVRNIISVIMASTEAFLALMDECENKAWSVRNNEIRKRSVLGFNSVEKNAGNIQTTDPIYPWPLYTVARTTSGKTELEVTYPGDSSVIQQTQAFNKEIWPEVEFVEEYFKGYSQRIPYPANPLAGLNDLVVTKISGNMIDVPFTNRFYSQKSENKFFYEIWERILSLGMYSGFDYKTETSTLLLSPLSQIESSVIVQSLSKENPYLITKLKNFDLNSENYENYLKQISNRGLGESWNKYIRNVFVTDYLETETLGPTSVLPGIITPSFTLSKSDEFDGFVKSTANRFPYLGIYPFNYEIWVSSNVTNSSLFPTVSEIYNTEKNLFYDKDYYLIKSNGVYAFSNFCYVNSTNPAVVGNTFSDLTNFYLNRNNPDKFLATEGKIYLNNSNNKLGYEQTTSILNTPYFVNAILDGVQKQKSGSTYPYINAAYLFVNSLPVATLRETFKKLVSIENNSYEDESLIGPTLKKFSAVHNLPYAFILKYGSIWYRYKKYIETGVDILSDNSGGQIVTFDNFKYAENYDPLTLNVNKEYFIGNEDDANYLSLKLRNQQPTSGPNPINVLTMNIGFYPKLIDNFHYFLNDSNLFDNYTASNVLSKTQSGDLICIKSTAGSVVGKSNYLQGGGNTQLNIFSWSVVTKTDNGNYCIMPSFGSNIKQYYYEIFGGDSQTYVDPDLNLPTINGSVRLFWNSPNYGYFDHNAMNLPTHKQYMKKIYPEISNQEAFGLIDYSSIEEIFSVFTKNDLDIFETQFLKFCLPVLSLDTKVRLNNFQSLMRSFFVVNAGSVTGFKKDDNGIKSFANAQFPTVISNIKNFLETTVYLRIGNCHSFDRSLFNTFNLNRVDDIGVVKYNSYFANTPNVLPYYTQVGSVLYQTIAANKPEAWKAFQLYIGFSSIPELDYESNNYSFLFDFFVQFDVEFTEENVIKFAPLVKLFATRKLENPSTLTDDSSEHVSLFKDYITTFFSNSLDLSKQILNDTLINVRKGLPDVSVGSLSVLETVYQSNPQKVEMYDRFKNLNDGWISGSDYLNPSHTLFEDIVFFDRAGRNIGAEIYCDVNHVKTVLSGALKENPVFGIIQEILNHENFSVTQNMAFCNYYGVQRPGENINPKFVGTADVANTLFGTFNTIDTQDTTAKIICEFNDMDSKYIDTPNDNYKFSNDSFDLIKVENNPLREDISNKSDFALSSKVVGFVVDFSNQNQNVFKTMNINSRTGGKNIVTVQNQLDVIEASSGKKSASQSVSLYNFYKGQSYDVSVTAMGNALLQPKMYFYLKNVPLFRGTYQINEVSHSITTTSFGTQFIGRRVPVYSIKKITDYLQSLKIQVLEKILNETKNAEEKSQGGTTIYSERDNKIINFKGGKRPTQNQACKPNEKYNTFENETPKQTTTSTTALIKAIEKVFPRPVNPAEQDYQKKVKENQNLWFIIYSIIYVANFQDGKLSSFNNNFGNIPLDVEYGGDLMKLAKKKFICLESLGGTSTSYMTFDTIDKNIEFIGKKLQSRANDFTSLDVNAVLIKQMTTIWTNYWPNFANDMYTQLKQTDPYSFNELELKVKKSLNLAKSNFTALPTF